MNPVSKAIDKLTVQGWTVGNCAKCHQMTTLVAGLCYVCRPKIVPKKG
jgi:hypothetical protein